MSARSVAKNAAANVFHYSGLRTAVGAWRRAQSGGRRVLVLGYHRVVEDFASEVRRSIPGTLISRRTFTRHLEDAHAAGFQFVTLGEALDALAGRRRFTRDLAVVTFDDGYRDVYEHALPVLQWMGIPSVMYLASDYVGTSSRFNHDRLFHLVGVLQRERLQPRYEALPPSAAALLQPILAGQQTVSAALDDFIGDWSSAHLTEAIGALEAQLAGASGTNSALVPPQGQVIGWDEARKMALGGMALGAHTRSHRVLTLESAEVIEEEIRGSRAAIEANTGAKVQDFAYCNGWYSDTVIDILKRQGFRSAVTTEDYPNARGVDPFALKRKVVWENFSVGLTGAYSSALMRCQLEDVFGALGMNHPVPGRRIQQPFESARTTE